MWEQLPAGGARGPEGDPREGRENPRKSICSFRLEMLCEVVGRESINSQLSAGEGILNALRDLKPTLVFKLEIYLGHQYSFRIVLISLTIALIPVCVACSTCEWFGVNRT